MEESLARAQHYRALAAQMQDSAKLETDEKRRNQFIDLANQYWRLADKLIGQHADRARS